ncbi:hypothetical protein Mal15_67750 [Stieleria maiorica]|uniref:Uncharacterized protein n=1 Tax=Stieleria maiorica TaxID=2795974 RepID=A0A5B9MNW6_9BACT|nr:hypothetical protein [Stieleria maiorica]QEG02654.1 hypothetical protein Mal15_67750 [Stieleria maiorica]
MSPTTHPTRPQPSETFSPSPSIEASDAIDASDALMISLASQRIVIVRRDERPSVRSAEQLCRPAAALRPGERVYYKGRPDRVRAMRVY